MQQPVPITSPPSSTTTSPSGWVATKRSTLSRNDDTPYAFCMTTSMASSVAGSAAGSTRRGVTPTDRSGVFGAYPGATQHSTNQGRDAERPGREPGPFEQSAAEAAGDHLTSTEAPASVSLVLAASAASLVAFSRTGLGAPSTRSLASFRPRLVSSRTTLMT